MKKILIAEDACIILIYLKQILTSKGFDVITTVSGPEAVKLATQYRPDLVISDIEMPGEYDGIEAIKIIINELYIPCILYSSRPRSFCIERLRSVRQWRFVNKSEGIAKLLNSIEQLTVRSAGLSARST